MPEHVDIASADCHEPKYMTAATAADAGKVLTPSSTAGQSELRKLSRTELSDLKEHYGEQLVTNNATTIATTAATDGTLNTNTDYAQVTSVWDATPSGQNNGITQGANGALTVSAAGVYKVSFWCNVSSDTASSYIAFKYVIDGTTFSGQKITAFVRNIGDMSHASATGFVSLTANQVLTLDYACDKSVAMTIEDLGIQMQLVRAT